MVDVDDVGLVGLFSMGKGDKVDCAEAEGIEQGGTRPPLPGITMVLRLLPLTRFRIVIEGLP